MSKVKEMQINESGIEAREKALAEKEQMLSQKLKQLEEAKAKAEAEAKARIEAEAKAKQAEMESKQFSKASERLGQFVGNHLRLPSKNEYLANNFGKWVVEGSNSITAQYYCQLGSVLHGMKYIRKIDIANEVMAYAMSFTGKLSYSEAIEKTYQAYIDTLTKKVEAI